MRIVLVLIINIILLSSCAHKNVSPNQLILTEGVEIQLLSPRSFGKQLSLTQFIEFEYESKSRELLVQSEITTDKMTVVGLTTGGTRLFTVTYDGKEINADGYSEVTKNIRPEYMLSDIQLSLWPISAVSRQFENASSCFINGSCLFVETDDQLQRTLTVNGEEIISIGYQMTPHFQSKIDFNNKLRDYQFTITLIAVEEL